MPARTAVGRPGAVGAGGSDARAWAPAAMAAVIDDPAGSEDGTAAGTAAGSVAGSVAATVTPDGATFGLWDGAVVEVVAVAAFLVVPCRARARARAARAVAAAVACFWALLFVGGTVVATGPERTVEVGEELTDVVVVVDPARVVAGAPTPPAGVPPSVVFFGAGPTWKESVTAAATATARATMDTNAVREVPSGNGPSPTTHCDHCFRCKPSDLLFKRSAPSSIHRHHRPSPRRPRRRSCDSPVRGAHRTAERRRAARRRGPTRTLRSTKYTDGPPPPEGHPYFHRARATDRVRGRRGRRDPWAPWCRPGRRRGHRARPPAHDGSMPVRTGHAPVPPE